MTNSIDRTVQLHGTAWELSDLTDAIADCQNEAWEERAWVPSDMLVDRRGGRMSLYVGQTYDPAKIDLVKGGWNHDHCEICWWDLYESADPDHGIGYTNGERWLCTECYAKLIAPSENVGNSSSS